MNFTLSDDHAVLRDSANGFLRKEVDLAPLLIPGASVGNAGYDRLWTKLAALGWPGVVVPEMYGGLGMSFIDLTIILEECGRFLAPSPLFGTLAGTLAVLASGSEDQKKRWLPAVADGKLKLALAIASRSGDCEGMNDEIAVARSEHGFSLTGPCHYVVDALAADRIVVAASLDGARRFFVVDRHSSAPAVDVLDWRDITRQVCTVRLSNTPAELLDGNPNDAWPWIRDRLCLVLAAESAGGLHAVLDDAVAYAKERIAFGNPIGAYQAIKHALADMLAQSECTSTAVLYAAWALSQEDDTGPLAAAMAQSQASDAYRDATFRGIQIFGAIGFTWEMKNHLYFKRARGNAELLGAPRTQRERLVRLLEAQPRDG